ncbi:MAG: hypothetical protein FDZ69_09070 [Deltaproteobacteria bacterium]|nr:MAG: hypothetical protein FDZ69_09070 [Deltaproteobacteria bacterium]
MTQFPDERWLLRAWWTGVAVLFALTYLLAPVKDPDFFWHLNTGEWILQHRALPAADPFSAGTGGAVDPRQYFILTSYWLAQLGYALLYALAGWGGFFIARAAILWLMIRALLARRHAWPLGYAVLVATFLVLLFARFPVERPQFLSFLAFAVVVALLERLGEARDTLPRDVAWGLPVVMLLWGNVHGGVLLGQILCAAHLLNNARRGWCGEISREFFCRSAALLAGAALIALATPNLTNYLPAYRETLDPKYQPFFALNLEYRSLYQLVAVERVWIYLFFPVIVLLAGYELLRDGLRRNLMQCVLLLCFAWFAFNSVRYLPFLGILALPAAGNGLARFGRQAGAVLLLLLFVGGIANSYQHLDNLRRLVRNGPLSVKFPQQAVEFVRQSGLRGNLLNDYDWGGYLGWALGEEHKVFVDGRTLDVEKYNDWVLLAGVLGGAQLGDEKHIDHFGKDRIVDHVLRKYRIDYMILPKSAGREPFWLSVAVAANPGWKAVYSDRQAVVFVRTGP